MDRPPDSFPSALNIELSWSVLSKMETVVRHLPSSPIQIQGGSAQKSISVGCCNHSRSAWRGVNGLYAPFVMPIIRLVTQILSPPRQMVKI
jgi:hypothetical protein